MKKYISILLCVVLISLTIMVPVYASNNELSIADMKEVLITYGLPMGYINSMTDFEIENLYNRVETGRSEIILNTEHATMDIQQNDINTYGKINEENFNLTVGTVIDYDDNNKVNKIVGFVIWQWVDGHPAGRRDDLLRIYWEPSVLTFTTANFESVDCYSTHLGEPVEYNRSSLPAESTTRDMVVYTDVYSGFGVDRGGWCIFTLFPTKPMYRGNSYFTALAVTYYHNKSLVPYVNNFTYEIIDGLQINFQEAFTDTLAASHAFSYS